MKSRRADGSKGMQRCPSGLNFQTYDKFWPGMRNEGKTRRILFSVATGSSSHQCSVETTPLVGPFVSVEVPRLVEVVRVPSSLCGAIKNLPLQSLAVLKQSITAISKSTTNHGVHK